MGRLLIRGHDVALLLSSAKNVGLKRDTSWQARILPLPTPAGSLAGHLRCDRKGIAQERCHRQPGADSR